MIPLTIGTVLAFALLAALWMAEPTIPGPLDEELALQQTTTQVASTNSAALDMKPGFAPGGPGLPMAVVIRVTAADRASGDETYSFRLQESADNVSFSDCSAAVAVEVAGNVATLGTIVAKGWVSKRFVRLVSTLGGTTPSVTFKAWLVPMP